jgi:VanZ family protein
MLRLIISFKPYSKYFLVAWIIIILAASSIPSLPTLKIKAAGSIIRLDYFIHFCIYGILTFLTFLTFADQNLKIILRKFITISAGLILFALIDELHQKIIPGRSFNMKDIYSNLLGISAALIFCLVVFRILNNKQT